MLIAARTSLLLQVRSEVNRFLRILQNKNYCLIFLSYFRKIFAAIIPNPAYNIYAVPIRGRKPRLPGIRRPGI
jgi:hypothetical protein